VITHVAIRFQKKIWSLPKPNRHHDVLRDIIAKTGVDSVDVPLEDEGFLDERGRFYNRKQALIHAELHGQLDTRTSKIRTSFLTSEDVW
jgi:hypothetical protein